MIENKIKEQCALTPAFLSNYIFRKNLIHLRKTTRIYSLFFVLFVFCFFIFYWPLIWFERNFKKNSIRKFGSFFWIAHWSNGKCMLFKWTSTVTPAMAMRASVFVKFVVRSVNKSQVWISIQLIICPLVS